MDSDKLPETQANGTPSNGAGLLSGLRVIDCATYIAGPAAATVMADFGADVIKIERPVSGDPYRYLSLVPGMPVSENQYCWSLDSRNKRSLALNLGHPEGRQILLRLVATADVFITNFQLQQLRRFQLAYEDLAPGNDRLIYAYVNGYGEEGTHADTPGFDATAYFARTGLMDVLYNEGQEPRISPPGFGDHPTAMTLFGAIMTGLYRRQITGKGMKVATSLVANGSWSNACLIQAALVEAQFPQRYSRRNAVNPLVNHYLACDGKRLFLVLLNPPREWPALCAATGLDALADDPRYATSGARMQNSPELIGILDGVFGQKTMAEWEELFHRHELIWSAVPPVVDFANDPQLEVSGIVTRMRDPSGESFRTVSNPLRFPGEAVRPHRYAPEIGQHTAEILSELGMTEEEIVGLAERAVVGV